MKNRNHKSAVVSAPVAPKCVVSQFAYDQLVFGLQSVIGDDEKLREEFDRIVSSVYKKPMWKRVRRVLKFSAQLEVASV